MDQKKGNGFFQDQDGNFSSGRLTAFLAVCTGILSVITAIIIGVLAMLWDKPTALPQYLLVAGPGLVSVGLGFQGWHKMSETGQLQARYSVSPFSVVSVPQGVEVPSNNQVKSGVSNTGGK